MYSSRYPDNYNYFELGYCGHPQFPYSKVFLDQASDLKPSHFQDEDHPFISEALRDENIQLVLLYYVYKPKTDASRTKNTNEDVNAYKYGPLIHWFSSSYDISCCVFLFRNTKDYVGQICSYKNGFP